MLYQYFDPFNQKLFRVETFNKHIRFRKKNRNEKCMQQVRAR